MPSEVEYVDRTKTGEVIGRSGRSRHDIDREIIRELVAAGADPAKPHRIEHHFGAVNRSIAQKIVDWAVENGYANSGIIDDKSEDGAFYYVDVINEIPLEVEAVARDSRRMESLAATIGCEYDGWGCEAVE